MDVSQPWCSNDFYQKKKNNTKKQKNHQHLHQQMRSLFQTVWINASPLTPKDEKSTN